jgi:hypothetical protein
MQRIREAVELCLDGQDGKTPSLELIGIHQISV